MTEPTNGSTANGNGTRYTFEPRSVERMCEMVENVMMLRRDMMTRLLDPRRNIEDECGYPRLGDSISPETYRQLYDRMAIATRVVQVLPKESWQVTPTVYEDEDAENVTEFEQAWDDLEVNLAGGSSWHQDEQGGTIWDQVIRADILSGIGQFGLILLGVDDGRNLQDPIEGTVVISNRRMTPIYNTAYPGQRANVVGARITFNTAPLMPDSPPTQAEVDALDALVTNGVIESKVPIWGRPRGADNIPGDHPTWTEVTESRKVTFLNSWRPTARAGVVSNEAASNALPLPDLTVNAPRKWPPPEDERKGRGVGTDPGPSEDKATDSQGRSPADAAAMGEGYPITSTDSGGQPLGYAPHASQGYGIPTGEKQKAEGMYQSPNPGTDAQYAWQGAPLPSALAGDSKQPLSGTDQQYFGIQFGPSEALPGREGPKQGAGQDEEELDEEEEGAEGEVEQPAKPRHRLIFMRAFSEDLVQVVRYEWNILNPRFGMPVMYRVTLNDPREQHSGVGLPMATVFVHWTRVIHIADNLGSSEIFGVPRQRPVLDNILALRKLYGASAEGYWKAGIPGLVLESNPQLGPDVVFDKAEFRDIMEQYQNGLQRYMALMGWTAKTLAPSVVDPTPQINVQIEAICIQLGIPVRIFKGSERGELASSQDDGAWNDRLRHRQMTYVTPRIICPLVDRLIALGVLPQPEGYSVKWPDLESLNDSAKAAIALQETQALAAYISGGVSQVMPEKDYFTRVLNYEDEEAEEILNNAAKHQEEQLQQQMQQQALGLGQPGAPGQPPGAPGQPPPGGPPGAGGGAPPFGKPGGGKPGQGPPPQGPPLQTPPPGAGQRNPLDDLLGNRGVTRNDLKGSYFGVCDRDAKGHCLPSGEHEGGHHDPREQPEHTAHQYEGLHGLEHATHGQFGGLSAYVVGKSVGKVTKAVAEAMADNPKLEKAGEALLGVYERVSKAVGGIADKLAERYGKATASFILGAGAVAAGAATHGLSAATGRVAGLVGGLPVLALAEAGRALGFVGKDSKLEKGLAKLGTFLQGVKGALGKAVSTTASVVSAPLRGLGKAIGEAASGFKVNANITLSPAEIKRQGEKVAREIAGVMRRAMRASGLSASDLSPLADILEDEGLLRNAIASERSEVEYDPRLVPNVLAVLNEICRDEKGRFSSECASTVASLIQAEHVSPPPPGKYLDASQIEKDHNGDGVADMARVGVGAMNVPSKIPKLPNLTHWERQAESEFIKAYEDDPQGMADQFRGIVLATTKPGNPPTFGTDDAKVLADAWVHPDLETRMENRATLNLPLHQTANAIAKRAFLQHLDTLEPGDEIMVTVGGCGAGKGHVLKTDLPDVNAIKATSKVVWDSAGDQNATENPWIQREAEARGLKVNYMYVHADPYVAWAHPDFGIIQRAMKPTDARMVAAEVVTDSYEKGAKNHQAFYEANKDNPNARFLFMENRGKPRQLDSIPKEALELDNAKLLKFCQQTVLEREGIPAHVKRGALVGERIWKDKPTGNANFNPDQPRDEIGQWTLSGSGSSSESTSAGTKHGQDTSRQEPDQSKREEQQKSGAGSSFGGWGSEEAAQAEIRMTDQEIVVARGGPINKDTPNFFSSQVETSSEEGGYGEGREFNLWRLDPKKVADISDDRILAKLGMTDRHIDRIEEMGLALYSDPPKWLLKRLARRGYSGFTDGGWVRLETSDGVLGKHLPKDRNS